ncbi:MAG: hypothetical protein SF123_16010 [Chloroflexota bacterium]|nr:hypothetical protein [Chloroflexota bacterium]
MYYLGIDWANGKHDVCLLDEIRRTAALLRGNGIAAPNMGAM